MLFSSRREKRQACDGNVAQRGKPKRFLGHLGVISPVSMEPIRPTKNPAVWYRGKLR